MTVSKLLPTVATISFVVAVTWRSYQTEWPTLGLVTQLGVCSLVSMVASAVLSVAWNGRSAVPTGSAAPNASLAGGAAALVRTVTLGVRAVTPGVRTAAL